MYIIPFFYILNVFVPRSLSTKYSFSFLLPTIHPLFTFGHACTACCFFFCCIYFTKHSWHTSAATSVVSRYSRGLIFLSKQWNHEIFASADIYSICMRHIYVDGLQTKSYDARNAFFCALWFLIKLLLNISVLSRRGDPLFVVIVFRHINNLQYEHSGGSDRSMSFFFLDGVR